MGQHLKEGEDYYLNEQGVLVFTASYHLKRGYCCQNGCRHCPYGFRKGAAKAPGGKEEKQ
ncbi:DUF5522 domain-containing protein [Botryobacter ruber]|uniref:DUF5522 domain-containing protein n=1 Tax=Botryobacter ruber TaxID=2171629 RepID=UPI000E0C1138|nr:DUF5522 domain-containing protein [Botryobacter ruber]